MDTNTRNQIILAAIAAAGAKDDGWETRVLTNAAEITTMFDDKSDVAKTIDKMASTKSFIGHVLSVKREASSTRGIVRLKTGTTYVKDGVPEGCEDARTERTDNPIGMAMATRAKELIGHRVAVWIEVEEASSGGRHFKVRVVRHIKDLGLSDEPEAKAALAAKKAKEGR